MASLVDLRGNVVSHETGKTMNMVRHKEGTYRELYAPASFVQEKEFIPDLGGLAARGVVLGSLPVNLGFSPLRGHLPGPIPGS